MTRDEARRRAEEALARYDAVLTRPLSEWRWDRFGDCISALSALLAAEPGGKTCGSISAVRSDATPAQPLPTCANCGSNLIAPAPSPARDEVREAAERLREQFAGHGPLTPFGQAAWDLLSALAAKPSARGGDRG